MEETVEQTKPEAGPDTASPYLTDHEVAAYMRLSPKFGYISVQKWAREGRLRGGKVGDHWRFRKTDVDDFIYSKR